MPELRSGSVGVGPKITHTLTNTGFTHRIDRSDGTAGRARTHTRIHPLTLLGSVGQVPHRRKEAEGGARRGDAAPADGGAKPKKRVHRVKKKRRRKRLDGRGGISALALPTPLCLARACQRTRKSEEEEGGTRSRLLLWIYSFIYLSILV